MRIAVNARLLREHPLEYYEYFIKEVFFRLAEQQPQHEFVFFFDKPFNPTFVFPVNVEPVVVSPKALHPLTVRWWFDVKIPHALKKYKADVFISPDGFCSLTTNVPQVLVIHDLAFLHYPKLIKNYLWFYKRYIPRSIKKAKVLCTVSKFLKQDIIKHYKVAEEKIWNVGSAANPVFKPVDWQERENIKNNFSDGCEYFVFIESGYSEKKLINLVKAFSIFKKWQKTNMKLLLAGKFAYQYKDFIEKLKTYKYRDDVKMLCVHDDELAKAMAAAYALVLPTLYEGFSVRVIEAMQCEVPIIISDKSSMREVAGEAALYADPLNPEEIAAQMKMIFKDEQLRSKLIDMGKIQVRNFTWERTVQLMWKSIEQAVS
ncbi:MAG: glycosyltransferase family 4 protein [Segetibacter sp.]|jgi:glycosyltransferase involved in cell wall biosynthesis|nr:glycosyltransferase family 4 protein [Segetibacter sp.]